MISPQWVVRSWGPRCKEFSPLCGVCIAWACYDFLVGWGNKGSACHLIITNRKRKKARSK